MDIPESAIPAGFQRRQEGNAVLVVRQECAERVYRALSPLYQAWGRIGQRRFTARGRAGIVSFPLGGGMPPMVVRRYYHGGLLASISKDLYLGPERALNELRVALAALQGGVRTPEPIGFLAQSVYGPLCRMAFLTLEISDSEDLVHYCCRLSEYPGETAAFEKRGVITEAAYQIRKMHDIGIYHGDLHLKNLLFRRRPVGVPEVYVIDFDCASVSSPLDADQRLRNLKRLARSVRKVHVAAQVITAWDRLRFLRAYLAGRPEARILIRRWARALANSGAGHEVWWTLTGAQRSLRGDRIARAVALGPERHSK